MCDVLAAFPSAKPAGDGWTAKCPAHEDQRASLSIGKGDDGRFLFKCHAGCSFDAILAGAHLEARDLFPQNGNGEGGRRIIKTYDYCDVHGDLQYQVVRFEPKDFRQRRPDGHGGWIWNTRGWHPSSIGGRSFKGVRRSSLSKARRTLTVCGHWASQRRATTVAPASGNRRIRNISSRPVKGAPW